MQYSTSIYYAERDEGEMKIDVTKLGDPKVACSVHYRTDPSPFENQKFTPVSGKLEFGPGEVTKSFHVPILLEKGFDSTKEFGLSLYDEDNCLLGLYLKSCRCKIVGRAVRLF